MSETASGAPAVLVERDGHAMIITINRPEVRNCVNKAVHVGVGEALEEADKNPDIWAVILTGAGDQAFCAGADLKAIARGESLRPDDPAQVAWGFAGYVQHYISKPTIAAVNGFALGGGTELTLASDLAVAADTAMFGLPEVKRGILAGAGGAFRMAQQVAPKVAMEILLTGDPFTAQRALELGFVNAVVPQAEVLPAALKLAARITVNAPLSVQASKRICRGIVDGNVTAEEAFWTQNRAESAILARSEDSREGPKAFAEKRAPQWKAR
ncbi:MAG: enoyl-CoA hydratase/isomerase family protein [Caulobacteraceae bacterium]|nr:enoyl-CoA hydratase/isomerase family protein [Caulobacteraceae bacterium]